MLPFTCEHALRAEEMGIVLPKGAEQRLILHQGQVFSHDTHGQHLSIGQRGCRSAFPQALALQKDFQHIVNLANECYDEFI